MNPKATTHNPLRSALTFSRQSSSCHIVASDEAPRLPVTMMRPTSQAEASKPRSLLPAAMRGFVASGCSGCVCLARQPWVRRLGDAETTATLGCEAS